jgi:hypothetical protein
VLGGPLVSAADLYCTWRAPDRVQACHSGLSHTNDRKAGGSNSPRLASLDDNGCTSNNFFCMVVQGEERADQERRRSRSACSSCVLFSATLPLRRTHTSRSSSSRRSFIRTVVGTPVMKLHLRRHHPLQILKSRLENDWLSYQYAWNSFNFPKNKRSEFLCNYSLSVDHFRDLESGERWPSSCLTTCPLKCRWRSTLIRSAHSERPRLS